jgi:inner membrane protein
LRLKWGESDFPLVPGCKLAGFSPGVHARLGGWAAEAETVAFEVALPLNGSGAIDFTPVGTQTTVRLDSRWPDPSFRGAFLPAKRSVSSTGFDAEWQVSYYGREFEPQWTDQTSAGALTAETARASQFGVAFLNVVDHYRNVERAIKYGVLFLALVFAAFFLFEVITALRIHPFQYTLVGAALCLFYLALLSLSEFIPFHFAYLAAALAATVMISLYCVAVLQSGQRTSIISTGLVGIYGFLYVTLQLQDYSLLAGTAGLFLVLAGLMYVTRRIDWYARDQAPPASPPPLPATK